MAEKERFRFGRAKKILVTSLLTASQISIPALVNPDSIWSPPLVKNPVCKQHVELLNFVHDPRRLVPAEPDSCAINITGTLIYKHSNHDGDTYMEVRLDPQFNYLVGKNNTKSGGRLVVEAICSHKAFKGGPYLEPSCEGFNRNLASIESVEVGQKIIFSGFRVEDTKHSHQHELHPLFFLASLNNAHGNRIFI